MKRESKQVWCVVVDPKGAVKVQAVKKFHGRSGSGYWTTWAWKFAPSFKSQVLAECESEEAAQQMLPVVIRTRADSLREQMADAERKLARVQMDASNARDRYESWAAAAKAAGVDL